jgi:VanZ family protein
MNTKFQAKAYLISPPVSSKKQSRNCRTDRKVSWRRASAWWVLLAMAVYGVADELLQRYMATRSCDVRDYVADLVGSLTGLILFSFLNFWLVLLIVVGITIFTLTNIARANLTDLIPITNAMFHFFAYGFFALVWIQYIHLYLLPKAQGVKWLIVSLALPVGLLASVKLFSIILGREFVVQDVIISIAAIIVTIFIVYLITLIRRPQEQL